MNYQSSYNINNSMQQLRENFQYLNKMVRFSSHSRVILKIVSDVNEMLGTAAESFLSLNPPIVYIN